MVCFVFLGLEMEGWRIGRRKRERREIERERERKREREKGTSEGITKVK
jgi:hypothetical protein